MSDVKFYNGDPLAILLLDKLHLTPVKFWLITVLVNNGSGLLAASISGALMSRPGQTGILQDPYAWFWNLVLAPLVWGTYLWTSNALASTIQSLRCSFVVEIPDCDLGPILRVYNAPSRKFIAMVVSVTTSIPYFIARSDVQGWDSATFITKLVTTIFWAIGMYMVSMLTLNLITNMWALHRIVRGKRLHIDPLHPDRCGGLRVLGEYALKTVYIAAVFGLVVGISEYRYITQGLVQKHWLVHLELPVYVALAATLFFVPIIDAHSGMKKARDNLLKRISGQFSYEYLFAVGHLGETAEILDARLTKIQQLQRLFDLTEKFPVWPFDTTILRKFFAAVITPLLPAATALITELAVHFVIPQPTPPP